MLNLDNQKYVQVKLSLHLNTLSRNRGLEDVHVDVVITDVKMPEMDGIELTKKIRTLTRKPKLLY